MFNMKAGKTRSTMTTVCFSLHSSIAQTPSTARPPTHPKTYLGTTNCTYCPYLPIPLRAANISGTHPRCTRTKTSTRASNTAIRRISSASSAANRSTDTRWHALYCVASHWLAVKPSWSPRRFRPASWMRGSFWGGGVSAFVRLIGFRVGGLVYPVCYHFVSGDECFAEIASEFAEFLHLC